MFCHVRVAWAHTRACACRKRRRRRRQAPPHAHASRAVSAFTQTKQTLNQTNTQQIFFSRRCPLIQGRLPLLHKLLYTNGAYAYLATILTDVAFVLVPFNSLVFGLHPVAFSYQLAVAVSFYLPISFLVTSYVRSRKHSKGQYLASISNHVLCFT